MTEKLGRRGEAATPNRFWGFAGKPKAEERRKKTGQGKEDRPAVRGLVCVGPRVGRGRTVGGAALCSHSTCSGGGLLHSSGIQTAPPVSPSPQVFFPGNGFRNVSFHFLVLQCGCGIQGLH